MRTRLSQFRPLRPRPLNRLNQIQRTMTMINPRNAINFFKTPAGAFLLFCVVLAVVFFACKRFLPGATKPQPLIYSTKAAAAAASKQTMQTDDANFSEHKLFAIAESSTIAHARNYG